MMVGKVIVEVSVGPQRVEVTVLIPLPIQQVSLDPTRTYIELPVGLVAYHHGQQHHQTFERDVPRELEGLPCVSVKARN